MQKQFNINYSRAIRNGDATFTAGEYVYDTATGAYIGTKEDYAGLADAVTAARESVAQLDAELAELPNNKRLSAANRMLLTKRKQAERQAWIDAMNKYAGEDLQENIDNNLQNSENSGNFAETNQGEQSNGSTRSNARDVQTRGSERVDEELGSEIREPRGGMESKIREPIHRETGRNQRGVREDSTISSEKQLPDEIVRSLGGGVLAWNVDVVDEHSELNAHIDDLLSKKGIKATSQPVVQVTAQSFYDAISKGKVLNENGWCVDVHNVEDYQNDKCFLVRFQGDDNTPGVAGIAVTQDGDIISLFSSQSGGGVSNKLIPFAIAVGGRKADFYMSHKENGLQNLYSRFGGQVVSATPFDAGYMEAENAEWVAYRERLVRENIEKRMSEEEAKEKAYKEAEDHTLGACIFPATMEEAIDFKAGHPKLEIVIEDVPLYETSENEFGYDRMIAARDAELRKQLEREAERNLPIDIAPPVDTTVTEPIDLTTDDVVLLVNKAKNRTQLAHRVEENGEVAYYSLSTHKKIRASEELSDEPWFEGTKHTVYRKVGNTYVPYIAFSTAKDLGNRFTGQIVPAEKYDGTTIPINTSIDKLYRKTDSGKYEQIGNAGKTEADYEGWRKKYTSLDKILDASVFGDITFWDLLQMWRGNARDSDVNRAKGTARKTYSSPLDVIKDKLPNAETELMLVKDRVLELLKIWNWYVKENSLDEQFTNDNMLSQEAEDMYRSMREDLYKDKAKQEERTLRINVPVNDAAGSLTTKNFTNPIYQMMVMLDMVREMDLMEDERKYPRIEGKERENLPKKLRYGFSKANTPKRSAEEILKEIRSERKYADAVELKDYVNGLSTQEIKELAQLVDSKRNGRDLRELSRFLQSVSKLFIDAEGSKAKKNKIRDAIKPNTQQADSTAEQQKEPMSAEDRKAQQERKDYLEEKEDIDGYLSEEEKAELDNINSQLAEFSIGQAEANPQSAERQLATKVALKCLDNARVKVVQVSDAEREGLFDNAHAQSVELMAVNDKFNQQLEEYTDENADNIKLDCGFPSEGLLLAGIPDKSIRLNGQTLRKKIRKHGFAAEDLKNLPMYLQHPIAVFEGTHPNTYGVLIEMILNGKNTLVAIDIKNAEVDGVTLVSSVYDKSATSVVTWINKGMMLSVDKTKALRYILTDAPIAPEDNRKGTSDTSIKNEEVISAAKVIQNFDTSKSFGENSAEYQIVYHGSSAVFDHFDHSFMGSGEGAQAYGWGTYVSEAKGILLVTRLHQSVIDRHLYLQRAESGYQSGAGAAKAIWSINSKRLLGIER